ncbi:RHS repeat-associated core domain-containing protein [Microbacterium sp. T2.11-28]|uniref:RHS repeat-associated core domain-containing protein n=1 Tax=Microbacterium sp. T2.11-28 TaxID=3041169 RepID=UPI0024775BB1|nr:RHS repeat-associated core domain-containing protein [Microbacterium sp. T2.11-28]CAI9389581.1 hypothetical protein MICABA_01152 [Microbacterium sp. T2.11-28]
MRTTLPTSTSLKALSGQSYDVGYTYTADGQVASTTLPKVSRPDGTTVMGKETVTTVYDDVSMPHWQTGGFGWGTYVAESMFDAQGRPLAMDLGNTYGAVVTYQWQDGTGQLSQLALDRERVDGTEIQIGYEYDEAGNVLSAIDQPANAAVLGNVDAQCFRYDALRRLKTMWTVGASECGAVPSSWSQVGGPAPGWTDFAYDALGNRTSKTVRSASGSVVTASTFGTGAAGPHQVVSQTVTGQSAVSFSWDAAGNRTGRTQGTSSSTYAWDAEGELSGTTGASGSVSNVYDADGSRLVRVDGANVTVFLPGGMEVTSSSASAVSATRWYSFAGKLVAHRTGNGLAGVTSVVTDPQGSVVGTVHNTDWASGVVRKRPDPFGGARSAGSVTSQGRGFLGAAHDSNALVLLGARFFDPGSGVFVSVDPLLDPGNPAQFNAYVYAGNNPATWSDPSGLAWTGPVADGGDHRYTWKGKTGTGKTKTKTGASSGSTRSSGGTSTVISGVTVTSHTAFGACGQSYNPCASKPLTAEQRKQTSIAMQGVLTAIGLVPVVGEFADGLAALICLGEGDMACVGLSVAAMVPVAGWAAAGAKGVKIGDDIVQATTSAGRGWARGDNIYSATRAGNSPSWSTVRSRFWKNEAANPQHGVWTESQLVRMKAGGAPQRYNPDKGGIESMELSHEPIPRRDGGIDVVPRWPQDHAAVDPFRHPGY